MVHEEDGVAGAGSNIGHDAADTVVSICVRAEREMLVHAFEFHRYYSTRENRDGVDLPSFGTCGHVRVVGARIAQVHVTGVDLARRGLVHPAGETMRRGGGLGGTDVANQSAEGTADDAVGDVGQVAKGAGGEDLRLLEASGIQSLIPPWELAVEPTLRTQHLLEGPDKVTVPDQELGVVVDVWLVQLMETNEVFIAIPRWWEGARGRSIDQALNGTEEG